MSIPSTVIILSGAFATDGGSISLLLSDPHGHKHNVLLSQHLLPPSGFPGERIPGRLYFNGSLVEIRSQDELTIISALKKASIKTPTPKKNSFNAIDSGQPGMIVGDDIKNYFDKIAEGPEAAIRHLVCELTGYVESEEYVTFARNQAK